jgi:hypothetical protein
LHNEDNGVSLRAYEDADGEITALFGLCGVRRRRSDLGSVSGVNLRFDDYDSKSHGMSSVHRFLVAFAIAVFVESEWWRVISSSSGVRC